MTNPPTHTMTFRGLPVRYVLTDDGPLFAATDAARILGISQDGPALRKRLRALPAGVVFHTRMATAAGSRTLAAISGPGLIQLTRLRNRAIDRDLRRWLENEALPLLSAPEVPEGFDAGVPGQLIAAASAFAVWYIQAVRDFPLHDISKQGELIALNAASLVDAVRAFNGEGARA